MNRNRILTFSLILALTLFITKSFGQTTQEEYNYITKGYKVQVESGLDMKKGYVMKDLGNWGLTTGAERRECTFKGLVRQGQTKPCAILMIYKRTDILNGATYYICIPSSKSTDEIWQQTLKFMNDNFSDNSSIMYKTMVWALMKFGSMESDK